MSKLPSSPLALSSTPSGFSIVDSTNLTLVASNMVVLHINEATNNNFDSIESAAKFIILNDFSIFKDKPGRILPKDIAKQFLKHLEEDGFINTKNGDFVTDEENLEYENIYWRLVRKNSPSDVGPIHADRWFWDLAGTSFPSSHTRIKVWIPLLQDDSNPSLQILPGSQKKKYSYGFTIDSFGKKKPTFKDVEIELAMIAAPVRVGEAIVFHDSLLHGGRTTSSDRVSIEFTIAQRNI
jgi:hypothetical protein